VKSILNHKYQHDDLDSKLVLALERISHVFRLLLWEQTKKYNLSPIQTQSLIHIFRQSEDERNITTLALKLNVTKATVSDAVKSLETKKLISKKADREDYRRQYLLLTKKGEELAKKIEGWVDKFKSKISEISESKKIDMYDTLLNLLLSFEEEGILSKHKICFSCRHLEQRKRNNKTIYFCHLLNKPLTDSEIRIDCPEHEGITNSDLPN
jgi:DNA-binding MarR family transcriptional regulator